MADEQGQSLGSERQIVSQQRADAEADLAAVGVEAFVESQSPGEASAGDHDLLAEPVLVRREVATVKADMAVSESELDALGQLPAEEPTKFGGVDSVLAVAGPRNLFQRHPQFRCDGNDHVELLPRLRILLLCPGGGGNQKQRQNCQG